MRENPGEPRYGVLAQQGAVARRREEREVHERLRRSTADGVGQEQVRRRTVHVAERREPDDQSAEFCGGPCGIVRDQRRTRPIEVGLLQPVRVRRKEWSEVRHDRECLPQSVLG